MKSLIRIAIVFALALAAAPAAKGSELWLHIRVTEAGSKPATVKVNVPYSLVERVAPIVERERIDDGEIDLNGERVEIAELRETWKALRSGKKTVARSDSSWTLVREGGDEFLVVRERGKSPGEVRIPARLVDALLSGSDRLNLEAAAAVIAQLGEGELLAVDDDGTKVRIWIDSTPEAE